MICWIHWYHNSNFRVESTHSKTVLEVPSSLIHISAVIEMILASQLNNDAQMQWIPPDERVCHRRTLICSQHHPIPVHSTASLGRYKITVLLCHFWTPLEPPTTHHPSIFQPCFAINLKLIDGVFFRREMVRRCSRWGQPALVIVLLYLCLYEDLGEENASNWIKSTACSRYYRFADTTLLLLHIS